MSDENLTLLQQAQAKARKEAQLNFGANTEDGKKGEAYVAVNKGWRSWSLVVYAKALMEKGKRTDKAVGFDVNVKL